MSSGRRVAVEGEGAGEPGARSRGGGRASVVALRPARGDQDVAARGKRVGDEEFELSDLVAAGRESGAVVPFHPEAARIETERTTQAIGALQGCRKVGQHGAEYAGATLHR